MRILIIEDEATLVGFLVRGLREKRFAVDAAFDGEEGFHMATTYEYDAIVLDLMLPKMDGHDLLQRFRELGHTTPVLILTARDKLEDKIEGFRRGTDDYLTKPFAFEELVARLHALIRRSRGVVRRTLTLDGIEIDLDAHRVTRAGEEIALGATEFRILEYLALNRGRLISRTELTEHIWAHDAEKLSNVINVHIANLRKKLHDDCERPLIETVRGAGYRLREAD